jgi:hypothetical protein
VDDLVIRAEPVRQALDRVVVLLNQATEQGAVDSNTLSFYADRRDELLAGYTRLVETATTAAGGNDSTRNAWLLELHRLLDDAQALARNISTNAIAAGSARMWKVALWSGVGVTAVVGALLGLRWYMNRRRR